MSIGAREGETRPPSRAAHRDASAGRRLLGVTLLSVLVARYGVFWLLAGVFALLADDGPTVALTVVVGAGSIGLAYALHRGNRIAWWVTLAVFGVSTVWRLSLVAGGAVDDLVNATVGAVVVGDLLWRRDAFQPSE